MKADMPICSQMLAKVLILSEINSDPTFALEEVSLDEIKDVSCKTEM